MSSRPPLGPGHRLFMMGGGLFFAASLTYAAVVYATEFGRQPAPWSWTQARAAIAADVLLFSAFALHHSAFARIGGKTWMARHVPEALERSVYVWCASALFIAVLWGWIAVPGVAWEVTSGPARSLMTIAQLAGLVITGLASRHIGVLSLAGVYGFVRHPIYFAWLLLVWPTPVMTGSRLLFAVVTTVYLAAAIPWEERSLRREIGPAYDDYCRQVRWRMVRGIY
jgi:protein-S-isoprenylcysteine O-methyltransferase Ste14